MLVCSLCSPLSSPSKRDPPTEENESTGTEIARQATSARAEAKTVLLLGRGRAAPGPGRAGARSGDGFVANPMPYSNSRWKASRLGYLSVGVVWRARRNVGATREGRIELSRIVPLEPGDVLAASFLSQSNASVGALRLSTVSKTRASEYWSEAAVGRLPAFTSGAV